MVNNFVTFQEIQVRLLNILELSRLNDYKHSISPETELVNQLSEMKMLLSRTPLVFDTTKLEEEMISSICKTVIYCWHLNIDLATLVDDFLSAFEAQKYMAT